MATPGTTQAAWHCPAGVFEESDLIKKCPLEQLRVPSLKGACKANGDRLEEAGSLTTNIWAENLAFSGRKVLE